MRRIFIGDIQGCGAQLDALLLALDVRPGDRLFCAGDLVNRGPDSLGVLRRLYRMNARIVLGNHDIHFLQVAAGTRPPGRYRHVLGAPDTPVLLDWLAAQPVMHVEDDLVLVHAGLHPHWTDLPTIAAQINTRLRAYIDGAPDEEIAFATTVRYCDAGGRRPPLDDPPPEPPFQPWDRFYTGTRTVVFGHWARRGLVNAPRLRGLDTGCVYGGRLTAWIAGEDRFVQVPGWHGH